MASTSNVPYNFFFKVTVKRILLSKAYYSI